MALGGKQIASPMDSTDGKINLKCIVSVTLMCTGLLNSFLVHVVFVLSSPFCPPLLSVDFGQFEDRCPWVFWHATWYCITIIVLMRTWSGTWGCSGSHRSWCLQDSALPPSPSGSYPLRRGGGGGYEDEEEEEGVNQSHVGGHRVLPVHQRLLEHWHYRHVTCQRSQGLDTWVVSCRIQYPYTS